MNKSAKTKQICNFYHGLNDNLPIKNLKLRVNSENYTCLSVGLRIMNFKARGHF